METDNIIGSTICPYCGQRISLANQNHICERMVYGPDKTNKPVEPEKLLENITKYREEFKQETNLSDSFLFVHAIGFRHEYVLWLEEKLYLADVALRGLSDLSATRMKTIDDLLEKLSKKE